MSKPRWFSLFFLMCLLLASLWITVWPPPGIFETEAAKAMESPGISTLLGRDSLGRNFFYRILQGAGVSITIGLCSSGLAFLIGVVLGGLITLLPRTVESFTLRGVEILMALPYIMLVAVLFLMLQTLWLESVSELVLITLSLALGSWMNTARITRNLLRAEMEKDYIEGAIAIGASWSRILWRHLFPNVFSSLLIFWSLQIPQALLAEGALSFLGFGVKAPHVSWGLLLQEGWKSFTNFPHMLLAPSLALFLTVLSLNTLMRRKSAL